jgi:hypothetical protein
METAIVLGSKNACYKLGSDKERWNTLIDEISEALCWELPRPCPSATVRLVAGTIQDAQ